MARRNTKNWLGRIVEAFERLGGDANYTALYAELAKGEPSLTPGQLAGIRREIENHSSDSGNYRRTRPDLFRSVGGIGSGHWGLRSFSVGVDEVHDGAEAFIETEEGRKRLRLHLTRERSKSLILQFKASLKSFTCDACGFDFEEKYGAHGKGYIEAHHIIPIASLENGQRTKLSDLAAVCANCHRMLHRDGLLTLEELKALLRH